MTNHDAKGCSRKKVVRPSLKKQLVIYLQRQYQKSLRLTCEVVSLHRSQWYYQSKKDDSEVIAKLNEYAEKIPTYGFDEYYCRLRKEGYKWNRKRELRVY